MSEHEIKKIFGFGQHEYDLIEENAIRNQQSIIEFIRNSTLCSLYDYSKIELDNYDGRY